eukprot:1031659-Pleurochrysis_carterae.AAC.4
MSAPTSSIPPRHSPCTWRARHPAQKPEKAECTLVESEHLRAFGSLAATCPSGACRWGSGRAAASGQRLTSR